MLEKNLQDILNAGIGLLKAGEENFSTALKNVEKVFNELKTKGATDNSEAAVKIREVLENTIRGVKEVSGKAESNFNLVLSEAQKNYAQVLEQIKKVVGDERIKDLNSKIEELASYIKQKSGASSGSASATPGAKPNPGAKKA